MGAGFGEVPYDEAKIATLIEQAKLSKQLQPQIQRLEKRYDIKFSLPYTEAVLTKIKTLSKRGVLKNRDLTGVVIQDWVDLQSWLVVKKIPKGTFTMGCTSEQGDDCDDDEKPTHKVTISKDFYMMESEVRQALYQQVMGSNRVSLRVQIDPSKV